MTPFVARSKKDVHGIRSLHRERSAPKFRFLPRLDPMEARTLLSTLTVLNNHDSGPGSLRSALAAAASGDTIDFASSLKGQTIALTTGELDISTSLDIDGPGSGLLTVSGSGASRVFETAAGLDVTISGLTIADGSAADQGGGILNDGSNLTLCGDALTGNIAFESATKSAKGGGLQSLGGDLTITDCQITCNQALGGGGTSAFGDAFGGGLYVAAGRATISDSQFSGDSARGGANSGDGLAGGGGIFVAAPTTLNGCIISDNVARGGDGAPNSGAYGGGFWIDPTSTTITASTFSGNQALGGNGGTGVFVGVAEGGAINSYGTVSISGSTFDRNQAQGGSGGDSGPNALGAFIDYGFGGAIANTQAAIDINGSRFSRNESAGGDDATCTDPTDLAAVGGAEGGALYTELGSSGMVAGCVFDHNRAQGGDGNTGIGSVVLVGEALGGAIVSGYGGNIYGPNTLSVSDSTITQNSAQGGDRNSGTGSVSGLVGTGAGAGIAYYAGGSASISGSELDHGRATGGRQNTASGPGAVVAGLGAGGGLFNYLGNFDSPTYGLFTTSTVTVSDSILDHNQARGGGGGNGEGGGIAEMFSVSTTVSSSAITHNQANGTGVGAGLGGGAFNDATSTLALDSALVTQNQANGSPGIGGGIYALGTFTFDPSTVIKGNHASTSGNDIGP